MASVVVNGDTSGAVTLSAPAVAGTVTVTLPAASGTMLTTASTGVVTQAMLSTNVAGNGPAFSAYLSTAQSVTNSTYTKAQINTEEFDTNSNYDNSTNYRFTPTVAGYYQIDGCLGFATTGSISGGVFATIYKNGARFKDGIFTAGTQVTNFYSVVSTLMYFNGSTDYSELWGYVTASGTITFNVNAGTVSYFQGVLVRGA